MRFAMPMGGTLEVRPSKKIDEDEIGSDEKVEGITYSIYWNDLLLPFSTDTRLQAYAIATGCQWGAFETFKEMLSNKAK